MFLLRLFDPEYIPQKQGVRQTMKTMINEQIAPDQPGDGVLIQQAQVPADERRIAPLESSSP
jgi:hypothetical protein